MEIRAINNKLEKIEDSLKMKERPVNLFIHEPGDPPGTGRRQLKNKLGDPEIFKKGLLLIRPGSGEPEVVKDISTMNLNNKEIKL